MGQGEDVMKDYLKFLPALLIVSALVGTNAVSTYKLDRLSEQMTNVQTFMSDMAVNRATTELRLEILEK